jgi:hypothetical protein
VSTGRAAAGIAALPAGLPGFGRVLTTGDADGVAEAGADAAEAGAEDRAEPATATGTDGSGAAAGGAPSD